MPAGATRALLRQDAARLRRYLRSRYGYAPVTWFLDPAWLCVLLHRLSHRAWRRERMKQARLFMQANSLLTGADIQPGSVIGGGLLAPSPAGVNISGRVGRNLVVMALGGIGGNTPDKDVGAGPGLPVLGDDVTVGQFTGIQGSIVIGDDVVFNPGSGVVASVPGGSRMWLNFDPQPGPRPPPAAPWPSIPPCGHASWRRTMADWRADADRYVDELMRFAPPGHPRPPRASAMLTNSLLALLGHRVSHWLALNGWRRLSRVVAGLNLFVHKLTVPPAACMGGGVLMPHVSGTLFHGRAGRYMAIFATALCSCPGNAAVQGLDQAPWLGDDVMVGGHGGVSGPVRLGDRVQIGPKTQLAQDVAPDYQVYDPMARGTVNRGGDAPPRAEPSLPGPPRTLPAGQPWRETWRRLRQDRARLAAQHGAAAPAFPAMTCVWLFRLSHALHATGWRRLARLCATANMALTGADLSPASEIGGGLVIPHPAGVALHGRAGCDLTVMAMAGFGALLGPDDGLVALDDAPQLGDGVHLSHHSGAYGAVTVGDGVTLMPGCVVTRPVPAHETLLPRPLRVRNRIAAEQARARVLQRRAEA